MMRARLRALVLGLLLVAAPPGTGGAVQPDEIMADPALEARARGITAGLRCLVCQNESVDDSAAPLARDLRLLVRERLKAGDSDRAVIDYLVARYGAFVLLKPPLARDTVLLWATPVLVLLGGAALAVIVLRRRRAGEAPLSAEEQAEIDAIRRRNTPS